MKPIHQSDILAFLRRRPIMSVAVSQDNKPMSSVLLFAVHDDFHFFFATRKGSYKARALQQNNQISWSVWHEHQMLVQADGRVSQVEQKARIASILDELANSAVSVEDFWPPVLRINPEDDYQVFEITPTWLRVLNMTETTIHTDHPPFYEVDLEVA